MKTVCLIVLIATLGVAGNASAIIRSPFPSRPSPPYQGHYITFGNDSMMAGQTAVKPSPSR